MPRWNDFTKTLSKQDHTRLMIALGAALQEMRHVSEVATGNGQFEAALDHMISAGQHYRDAAAILFREPA